MEMSSSSVCDPGSERTRELSRLTACAAWCGDKLTRQFMDDVRVVRCLAGIRADHLGLSPLEASEAIM